MALYNTPEHNPCLSEYNFSMKCLDKNGYDYDKCEPEFENYRTCKKFWGHIERQRKVRGIKPAMPGIEEREKIKADFMKSAK